MTYTYEQFEKAARDSGLYGQFSSADLSLAQQNPDAGMSILKYKTDFRNATTDEARALANQGAEQIRSSYGSYIGGGNGGSFSLTPLSPGSFTADPAPTYQNRYDDQIQQMLSGIINREDFSYDAETDPLYAQYRKAYAREGERATQDTLGAAAAASGGIPSSYAATAAAQAGDYYAAQMTDKIPELYQIAYDKYLNDYQMQLNDLSTVQNAEQIDYSKYLNELSQYNTDRSFNYGKLLDEISSQAQERQEQIAGAERAASWGDYSQLEKLGIDMSNNPVEYAKQLELAQLGAGYGDYAGLNALGIDTSNNPADIERAYALAQIAAGYGDYSALQKLGIDTSNNPEAYERAYNRAVLAAQYGDFSGLRSLGIEPNSVALANFKKAIDDEPKISLDESDIASIKSAYGSELDDQEVSTLLGAFDGLTTEDLIAAGFTIGGGTGQTGAVETITPEWKPPEGSPVWTEDSDTPGFDQASVTVIGSRLGIGTVSPEMLNDLIDYGVVEHYVANNQDRFRLTDDWKTKWENMRFAAGEGKFAGSGFSGGRSDVTVDLYQ